MTARAHNLTDMVEYLESELIQSDEYDFTQICDETELHLQKSKSLVPLRPIHLQDGESYHVQWPMTNLRAKEAQRAAQVFQARKLQDDSKPASFFQNQEFASTSNKEVANILETSKAQEPAKTQ